MCQGHDIIHFINPDKLHVGIIEDKLHANQLVWFKHITSNINNIERSGQIPYENVKTESMMNTGIGKATGRCDLRKIL